MHEVEAALYLITIRIGELSAQAYQFVAQHVAQGTLSYLSCKVARAWKSPERAAILPDDKRLVCLSNLVE